MDKDPGEWFYDYITSNLVQLHRVQAVIYSGRTRFQSVQIVDTAGFGRCLILDGKVQSSQADEFIYHEALVHPALIAHPNPRTVFIAGGGEGATLREVLAHRSVARAVMVDIDEEVIELCREHLPSFHQGAFQDSRAQLFYTDAKKYLEDCPDRFDVIIIDLPEPLEEGPAHLLYTLEFYQFLRQRLAPDGILTLQAGSASWDNLLSFSAITHTLRAVFSIVCPYQVAVPSYGCPWGFATASQALNPGALSREEIDRRTPSRLSRALRFYDGLSHQSIFSLPKHLRDEMEREKRLITEKEPLFIYGTKGISPR